MTPAPATPLSTCLSCGYDLSSTAPADGAYLCPECGDRTTIHELEHPPFRRIQRAFTNAALLVAAICVFALAFIQTIGPYVLFEIVASAAIAPLIIAFHFHYALRRSYRRRLWKRFALWAAIHVAAVFEVTIFGTLLVAR